MSSGFLLIDKPAGITSHDVVDALRRITGIKKIGHAGTLDPFATGLLLVAIGREATREISKFSGLDKIYEAEFVLGATTETLDPESPIAYANTPIIWSRRRIEAAMRSFLGKQKQIPPMYAAIKQGGKKLYELARQGKTVERAPRDIEIFAFDLTRDPYGLRPEMCSRYDGPSLETTRLHVRIHCSSGTYIRAIARDLGEKLGTLGYLYSLRRTAIGNYRIEDAKNLKFLTPENWKNSLIQAN